MLQQGPIKSIIAGTVGGALGASLAAGILAITGAIDVDAISYNALIALITAGEATAVILAFAYHKLPESFVVRAISATVLYTGISWVVVFPQLGIPFSTGLAIASVIANAAYGVLSMFILNQAIGLALPLVPMSRRAEEFSDTPSEA